MIDRYSRPELRALWSDQRRFDTWLEVELAACAAMETEGVVPAHTAEHVRKKATGKLSPARILEIEEKTRHDVIAFLTHVEEIAGVDARWLHLGLTSSDVLDTATAILARDAVGLLIQGLDALLGALRRRAEEHKRTPIIGRSHGIHAEPTTLGLVFAGFYAEGRRSRERLIAAQRRIAVGKLAGAVGTYANSNPHVERAALEALGLRPETVATQIVARDRHAELLSTLAMLGGFIERIGLAVRHWQRTEVGEAEEAFGKGQKGSSAMPHKKNPILSENLTGLSRLLRANAGAALENIALWHERDISHSSVERVILPDSTTLADFMLHRSAALVEGLVVHPVRMLHNLALTGGLIFSEGVMLAMIKKGIERQRAYEIVQRSALKARDQGGDFRALLGADPEISSVLSPVELITCFDIQHHLRSVDAIFERVFENGSQA